MEDLVIFFSLPILIGVFAGGLIFVHHQQRESPVDPLSNVGRENPMNLHRGINSTSIAGEGLQGIPGLVIAVAFVFMFLSLFLPRNSDWPLVMFITAEIGVTVLYILSVRRNRENSERLKRELHQINEQQDH